MKLTVYVLTSDKYLDAVPPFAHLFNKYWSPTQEVIVCGFNPPSTLPNNFTFFSLGKMSNYPVNKWTDALIQLLRHFPLNDIFMLMLEDYWLTKQADLTAVKMLTDYMRQFTNVVKMGCLQIDGRFAGNVIREFDNNRCGHIPLVRSNPNDQYHMSLMSGLWNRDALLSILHPGETPWEVETTGQTYRNLIARGDELLVLGTDVPEDYPSDWCPVHHTLAHRRGDPTKYAFNEDVTFGLSKADIDELLQLKLIDRSRL